MPHRVNEEKLTAFCKEALIRKGMCEEDALAMAKALVIADMWGLNTHGTKNLYGYMTKADAGGVSFKDRPAVERELPAAAVIDGHNTMGYVSGVMGMNKAAELAKKCGIGMALVKNSCHFGATGVYSNIAAKQGLIGFAASNVDKKMGIPGARGMVMGHNPFSFAAPALSMPSVILDISSSNVASLKVLKHKALGLDIPDTWITDADGVPTTDPSGYPDEGALMPMGGHKGYGIAVFVEMMTSILLGKSPSTRDDVTSWCFDLDKPNNVCHIFIAIDPSLISEGSFPERVEAFIEDLHSAPKAKGTASVLVPGEDMWQRYAVCKKDGILLPDDVWEELEKVSAETGLSLKEMEI